MLLFGLLHRYYVGKRSPAGWTAWPTSARASPSSRAVSPRSGWPQQPCRATSASASTRRSRGTQRMRSPPPPLQPPQPQALREPVDIPGSKLCPACPQITSPSLLYDLFLTPFHTPWFLSSSADNTGEGRPFLLRRWSFSPFSKGCHYSCSAKWPWTPALNRGVWWLNWILLPGPPRSSIHGELLALSGTRSFVQAGGLHTVMFLLWNCFIFLSLPPPMWAQQPPLYFGWVCHSPMTNLLPTPSEGSRARTQPSHLLDQQQAPLSPIPFVIIRFLTHVKDKWKVLLFYNHQFSVLKFKSSNDCPALENNNKEPRKWMCYRGFSLGSKRGWG